MTSFNNKNPAADDGVASSSTDSTTGPFHLSSGMRVSNGNPPLLPVFALLSIYNGDQEVVSGEWRQLSAPIPNWLYVLFLINGLQLLQSPVDFIALIGLSN